MCPEERYDPTGQSEEATEVYAAPLTTLRNINRKGEREKERELTGIRAQFAFGLSRQY